jgi:flagellar basal-body rod protein FlgG
MLVNQVRLENISNNLSNLNTPGYKRTEVVARTFPEVLLYRTEKIGHGMPVENRTRFFTHGYPHGPIGIAAENIAVEETILIHIPGAPRMTERHLDLALGQPGFFVVQTPQGLAYTRDGHLQLSADGTLINASGFPVLGERGPIVLNMERPDIDQAGNIYQDGQFIDRLRVVNFADNDPLRKDGYNLFRVDADTTPQAVNAGSIHQGYLEESNADLSKQMTDLIRVRRSYEAAQKISQVYDRMLSRAANDLGSLG